VAISVSGRLFLRHTEASTKPDQIRLRMDSKTGRTAKARDAAAVIGRGCPTRARGQGLPSATRPATLSVVLLALTASREQGFRRSDLETLGVPDRAYAGGVLRFLDLLERSRPHRPKKALLDARARAAERCDPGLIRSFLLGQLAEGCRRGIGPDFDPEWLGELGLADLHSGDLDAIAERLLDAAVRSRPDSLRPEKRDKTATCLKALHDAILRSDDSAWLADQSGLSLDWLAEQPGIDARQAFPWSSTVKKGQAGATGPRPVGTLASGPGIGVPSGQGTTLREAGSFRVAREEDDRPVIARVYFERRETPGQPEWLEELGPKHAAWLEQTALRLLDMADSLRRGTGG